MPVSIPKRTGLKSIAALLHKVCRLVAAWRDLWTSFMTDEQIAVMDNLVTVCNDVVSLINSIVGS